MGAYSRNKGTAEISRERLTDLLAYDPESGVFTWRVGRRGRFARPGARAGSDSRRLYTRITIDGREYYAHRLAWLYVHGSWPVEIDHINGNGKDNRLANLRDVSRAVNSQNIRRTRPNRNGYRGVRSCPGGFRAHIEAFGEAHLSRLFPTAELAHEWYLSKRSELHLGAVEGVAQ